LENKKPANLFEKNICFFAYQRVGPHQLKRVQTKTKNRYQKIFTEELLDGFATPPYYSSYKAFMRKIESREEFDAILENADEPRGIITKDAFYLSTKDSNEIMHLSFLEFLKKKRIIKSDVTVDDEYYDDFVDEFITVQVFRKKVWIGESYTTKFKNAVRTSETDLNAFWYVLAKLGIPKVKDFI
jgi:hypothetical protein